MLQFPVALSKRAPTVSPQVAPQARSPHRVRHRAIALVLGTLGGLAIPLSRPAVSLEPSTAVVNPHPAPSELAQRIIIRRWGDRHNRYDYHDRYDYYDYNERYPGDWRDDDDRRDRLPRCYPGYGCYPRYEYRPRRRPEPPAPLPLVSTQDCTDLTVMARLSYMWDAGSSLSDAVTGAQLAVCSSSGISDSLSRWSNGQVARFGNGWNYPNGVAGRFGSAWQYPNGQTLTSGSSWFYPNGRSARFGANWYTPSGRPVSQQELLSLACGELGTRQCGDRLQQVAANSGFWYDLTVVELAWLSGR